MRMTYNGKYVYPIFCRLANPGLSVTMIMLHCSYDAKLLLVPASVESSKWATYMIVNSSNEDRFIERETKKIHKAEPRKLYSYPPNPIPPTNIDLSSFKEVFDHPRLRTHPPPYKVEPDSSPSPHLAFFHMKLFFSPLSVALLLAGLFFQQSRSQPVPGVDFRITIGKSGTCWRKFF